MAERIPEQTINEVKNAVDIVDVVSEYVHLKKQGRNYFGLCPFHGESTPSFSVSPDKQIFHCFGCGAGGNVFSFLMDIEGISFQEAILKVAEKGNIHLHINESYTPEQEKKTTEYDKMVEAHELLCKFYHHILVNTKEGQEALEYLENRGMTKEVIDKFQIGYALPSRDFAVKFLIKRGFSYQILQKAGLINVREETGEYFDRFWDRIMFPIFDHKGKVIAFSGRTFRPDGSPKYLNSPETEIFHKSKILYNFHQARPSIRKLQTAILFEGFADCISAFNAGVYNGIATMGTALTEDHIHTIKRNAEKVIVCYDSDSAGIEAAYKAGVLLNEAGVSIQVAVMPDGMDPDDFIRKFGPERFMSEVIESSQTFFTFKMMYFRRGKNLLHEGDRLRYIEEVLVELNKIQNAVEQDLYLRQLAEEFSLSLDALKQQQKALMKNHKKWKTIDYGQKPLEKLPSQQRLKPAYFNAERRLIAHMLRSREIANKVQEKMEGHMFNIDDHQAIYAYLLAFYEEGNEPDLSTFLTFINDSHLRNLTAEIGMLQINEEISEKELADYIYHVLKNQKMLRIKEKEEEKKEAERKKDYIRAAAIAMEIIQLRKSL